MTLVKLLLALCLVFFNRYSLAHGVVHQQIDVLTVQIDQQPTNTQLLLKRGQLYADDQNWLEAEKDFDTVRQLKSTIPIVDLMEAKMWYSANRLEHSYSLVNRYLQQEPDVPAAFALRAKICLMQGNPDSASTDFAKVINLSNKILPDMYLQWAKAQAKIIPLNKQQVHQIIQSGVDRLGPLVVLLQYAIDFDRQQKDFKSALMGIEKLPQQLRQQPFWLVQKANLLKSLKKHKEAKIQYQMALGRLHKKKQSGRFNQADQKLLEKINQSLHS